MQTTKLQKQKTAKTYRMLARQWLGLKHLPRYVEEARVGNPLLDRAADLIATRDPQRVRDEENPAVRQLVDRILRDHRPSPRALKGAKPSLEQQEAAENLAEDLWPGRRPVMVAFSSHFEGEYPEQPGAHSCRTYWTAVCRGDQVEKIAPVTFALWRQITTKKGETIFCFQCWTERVRGFCRDIEKASLGYEELGSLRYLAVDDTDYPRLAARIRKHNSRHDVTVNYTSFPLESGTTIVLHDAPEWLGGGKLPAERSRLFALVSRWAKTPKGRRAGHGLGSWGLEPEEKGTQKGGTSKQASKEGKRWQIWGVRYGLTAKLVAAHLDTKPGKKGMRTPNLSAQEFIKLLERAGIDYAKEGDIPDVTVNTSTPTPLCANRDTGTQLALLPNNNQRGTPNLEAPP